MLRSRIERSQGLVDASAGCSMALPGLRRGHAVQPEPPSAAVQLQLLPHFKFLTALSCQWYPSQSDSERYSCFFLAPF